MNKSSNLYDSDIKGKKFAPKKSRMIAAEAKKKYYEYISTTKQTTFFLD